MKILSVYQAQEAHMPGLKTWRALPIRSLEEFNPYLFLNHHGPENFPANNSGLPFGPHPHRGFETLTFIVDGELIHQDSEGFSSNIHAGGVQWMTAGAGIIHSETSSEEFLRKGGKLEILQLWINLPADLKSSPAHYQGLEYPDIPHLDLGEGVRLDLICGEFQGEKGPVTSPYPQFMSTLRVRGGSNFTLQTGQKQKLFYLVSGKITIEGKEYGARSLFKLAPHAFDLEISALEDAYIIYGEADPIKEPIAAQGPFVMNYPGEIKQAILDYQEGKFGVWKA